MLQFIAEHYYGILGLGFWGYVIAGAIGVHITLIAITLYHHREQAHRSVDLHPALRHFFRFWLWMNTGVITREWVAVHRKHHAMCERDGDPHSPQLFGLKKVLLEGAELYRKEACNPETLEKYGRGTPDDWVERHIYTRWPNVGVSLLFVVDVFLFGAPGIALYGIQLITMPLLAAGIINGLSHARGYRNFETADASTNLWPLAVFVAGEELHNNHHAFPSSARFSQRPWEVDLGWLHLLRHYRKSVTFTVLRGEVRQNRGKPKTPVHRAKRWLTRHPSLLDNQSRERLAELMEKYPSLNTVVEYRNELKALWESTDLSNERLLAELMGWCNRAEASGIKALEEFSAYLKSFRPTPRLAG